MHTVTHGSTALDVVIVDDATVAIGANPNALNVSLRGSQRPV
jgi:hypothetical protein